MAISLLLQSTGVQECVRAFRQLPVYARRAVLLVRGPDRYVHSHNKPLLKEILDFVLSVWHVDIATRSSSSSSETS